MYVIDSEAVKRTCVCVWERERERVHACIYDLIVSFISNFVKGITLSGSLLIFQSLTSTAFLSLALLLSHALLITCKSVR